MSDDGEQPAAVGADEALAAVEAHPEVETRPEAETAAEPPETSLAAELAPDSHVETPEPENITTTVSEEVLADIDQPILSQEVEHPAVEGGSIIDEPFVVDTTADDLSVDKTQRWHAS
jgi:hypothetical protein